MTRRLAAALLALVFSFGLMSPVVSAQDNLPACCRNKGKHHCSGTNDRHDGPAVQAARCSSFPCTQSLPPQLATGVPVAAGSSGVLAAVQTVGNLYAAQPRTALSRAHSERGPPSLPA